jgi:hypothetical protein
MTPAKHSVTETMNIIFKTYKLGEKNVLTHFTFMKWVEEKKKFQSNRNRNAITQMIIQRTLD